MRDCIFDIFLTDLWLRFPCLFFAIGRISHVRYLSFLRFKYIPGGDSWSRQA